jgi:uncharacterized protein (TIGR03000 family)
MYSMVLMVALTAGLDAPAWGHHHPKGPCSGGYCGSYGGGRGCNKACVPTYGGYNDCGCGGYGCGGYGDGGWSCYNGGGPACCGGSLTPAPAAAPAAVKASSDYVVPAPLPSAARTSPSPASDGKELELTSIRAEESRPVSNSARLVVDLPADARLYINGGLYPTRTFRTPALESGKPYHYVVRAEIVRDGRTESETRYVGVTAGDEITVSFQNLDRLVAAKR